MAMSLDEQDIRALTFIATRLRPAHSPHAAWDEAGIAACIAKVRQFSLAEVARAVINAASDPTAKTPGLIADMTSSAWREKPIEPIVHPPRICREHGIQFTTVCPGCRADQLEAEQKARAAQLQTDIEGASR
jgi:hypothetical protein